MPHIEVQSYGADHGLRARIEQWLEEHRIAGHTARAIHSDELPPSGEPAPSPEPATPQARPE